jgi:membrane fusion protein (multidrug efflux system)
VSDGALIRPGTRITTLDDTTTIKLDFEVPETALANLEPGLEISATGAAFPERVFFGRVATVDSRVDPISRSIRVRAAVPNPEGLLKPGMFLTVQLVLGRRPNATLIPEESVVASGASQFVYRVVDGKARRTPVVLGQRLPGFVEVLSGVKPGEQVIIGGVQKVRDGVPVRDAGAANAAGGKPEAKRPSGAAAPQS